MKKSLLAAALTLATGGAIAQSSVTLYGVIDEGYIKESSKASVPIGNQTYTGEISSQRFEHGLSSSNRFGIKTQEDLGDGLTAKATIEFGFGEPTPDNQSAVHALRQAWVSLDNNEGHSVKVGRIQSQSLEILSETDASGSAKTVGSILAVRDTSLDSRQGIMYSYKQPGYGFGLGYYYNDKKYQVEQWSHAEKGKGYELSAHFDDGFAFGKVVYAAGTLGYTNDSYGSEYKRNLLTTNIGVKPIPGTKISYTYQNHKLTQTITSAYLPESIYKDKLKSDAHQINLNHMLTPKVELLSSYSSGMINENYSLALFGNYYSGPISSFKGTGYQFGSRYHFSKRTNVYALYGRDTWKVNLEEEGINNIRAKRETIAIGLKHMF